MSFLDQDGKLRYGKQRPDRDRVKVFKLMDKWGLTEEMARWQFARDQFLKKNPGALLIPGMLGYDEGPRMP